MSLNNFPSESSSALNNRLDFVESYSWEMDFLSLLKKNKFNSISVLEHNGKTIFLPKVSVVTGEERANFLSLGAPECIEYMAFGFTTALNFQLADIISSKIDTINFNSSDIKKEEMVILLANFLKQQSLELSEAKKSLFKRIGLLVGAEMISPGPIPAPIPVLLPLFLFVPKFWINYSQIQKKIDTALKKIETIDLNYSVGAEIKNCDMIDFETRNIKNLTERALSGTVYLKNVLLSILK